MSVNLPSRLIPLLILSVILSQPMVCATITPYRQFQKGMSYVVYSRDTYMTTGSDESLEALAETGVNWVALIVTWYQQTYRDTSIDPDPVMTPTDESVVHAVETIHRLGMEVMLKPHVDPSDGHWRGEIEPKNVEMWFGNYGAFIVHYAELAQAHDVEMFCVGTELNSMTERSVRCLLGFNNRGCPTSLWGRSDICGQLVA